jgi:hypothetical protein
MRARKATAAAVLLVAGVAGSATAPAQRAFCSARVFVRYYEALGQSSLASSSTWDRVTLSATLTMADSAGEPSRPEPCSERHAD